MEPYNPDIDDMIIVPERVTPAVIVSDRIEVVVKSERMLSPDLSLSIVQLCMYQPLILDLRHDVLRCVPSGKTLNAMTKFAYKLSRQPPTPTYMEIKGKERQSFAIR